MIRINKCTKIVYLLWILAHFKRTTLMGNTWSRQDRGTKQFFNSWCKAGTPVPSKTKTYENVMWMPEISRHPFVLCSQAAWLAGGCATSSTAYRR